jgi:hypothetical protein
LKTKGRRDFSQHTRREKVARAEKFARLLAETTCKPNSAKKILGESNKQLPSNQRSTSKDEETKMAKKVKKAAKRRPAAKKARKTVRKVVRKGARKAKKTAKKVVRKARKVVRKAAKRRTVRKAKAPATAM